MNRASVFEWHKRFKEGRQSVRDDERCERSKEVNRPELIGQRVRVRVTMLRFLRECWNYTSLILNQNFFWASAFKQVVRIAQSSLCLTIFRYNQYNLGWTDVHSTFTVVSF